MDMTKSQRWKSTSVTIHGIFLGTNYRPPHPRLLHCRINIMGFVKQADRLSLYPAFMHRGTLYYVALFSCLALGLYFQTRGHYNW